jgi:hypothetical protein
VNKDVKLFQERKITQRVGGSAYRVITRQCRVADD